MKILAIDTTSKICSTAILEEEKIIDENTINNGLTHSENLMPLIAELLERNKLNILDIDLIAVCVGPGSFTGIRIGIATIKPMAEICNIPVAAVTSLENLAKNVNKANTIVSLIDARNDQVYAGIFDENINLKQEYMADDINIVLEKIQKCDDIIFVGDGSILHKELILNKFPNAKFLEKNDQNAINVGLIGYKKYLEKDLKDADSILPIYLRNK